MVILRRRDGAEGIIPGNMRNPFTGLKPEMAQSERTQQISETALVRITRVWKAFTLPGLISMIGVSKEGCDEVTQELMSRMKNIEYTAKDVEEFSKRLVTLQEGEENFPLKAGLFLSALINNAKDEDFVVHTAQLKRKPTCLGYLNTKNVVVEGGLAWGAAYRMITGTFEVKGNIGKAGGRNMDCGELIIRGNAQKELGKQMKGGKISTYGKVVSVGGDRKGGEIHLEGETEPYIEATRDGKIYKKGELFQDGHGR
jgi:hypothetical protein